MVEVLRDLPALLDYTGYALIVGGERDGDVWVLNRADQEWSRPDGTGRWLPHSMPRITADYGGRVAAVLPEGAEKPPVGSEVRMVRGDETGAPLTHTADGWHWLHDGQRVTKDATDWDEYVETAWSAVRSVELLAIPTTGEHAEPDPPAVEARQLTDNADWGAFVRWCDAYDRHHPDEGWLMVVPGAGSARIGDWVVRGEDGVFTVVPGRHADAILRSHRGNA